MSKPVALDVVHHVRDACLCLATQRAARTLARRFDRAFQPVGLTNGQFSLMMALGGAGTMRLGDLAEFLAMDRTTLTAALKALERRGLARSGPDATDKRARLLALTEAGHDVLHAAVPIWRAEHAALERELPADMADGLRAALTRVASQGGGGA
ncbi:winged helix-turn-helix transcriptional regulator [Phreatobacter aquaticus]|uniref:Winged helix-turn-helix transcriptional regulator n=1 Tax=Phreatobacter aquaticus TaxID=2570229 RepID=A0A4D7QR21_9HYPH|nr:MarR family winged helix-turn-helix transcriptional regulator [Phreatobacter aquaticus]QCK88046.1 winged helix-turn-helix transcriptional regulator [Phreatobacter aquaticus]